MSRSAFLLAATAVAIASGSACAADDPFRPRFHFTPEKNWMNDPNGMVWHDGEWHLFYQYNPFGAQWGHMSWGHAVSRDLLRWERLPLALAEEDGIMIFSGSAVVDTANTSGFGKDGGPPPMVAIYTAHTPDRQSQAIACSNDRGRTWTKFAGNPVLDIAEKDFRDPKVMWHEPTRRWIMTVALSAERKVRFYASPDLKSWSHLSDFGPAGATSGIWECPDLFPLPVDGEPGKSAWVLIVNTSDGAPAGASGGQYFPGTFDGTAFAADDNTVRWLDYGPDFYAAVTWNGAPDGDSRRILLAWMSRPRYAGATPTSPWRSAMTVPRELSLVRAPDGLRLASRPVRELRDLPGGAPKSFSGGTADEAAAWLARESIAGNALDLAVTLDLAAGRQAHIDVLANDDVRTRLTVDADRRTLALDRTRSGNTGFAADFPLRCEAPLPASFDGTTLDLRIVVDACSVEAFAGTAALTALAFPPPDARQVRIAGPAAVRRFEARSLAPPAENPNP